MSTLTYTNSQYAAPSTATTPRHCGGAPLMPSSSPGNAGPIVRSPPYLQSHGGLLTDDLEREIMSRLQGRRGVSF